MTLPPLPEALIVRRNAHGFTHSFTALQMDQYGRDCTQAAIAAQAGEIERLRDSFTVFVGHVQALIDNSRGLYGLHQNGDESPWDELTEGGRFEEWLGLPLSDAIAAMTKEPK